MARGLYLEEWNVGRMEECLPARLPTLLGRQGMMEKG